MSTRLSAGQTWFVVLPGEKPTSCVLIDEVTRKTVVLRGESDLGRKCFEAATRFARADLRWVERVP
jgi:hypothetical protein